MSYVYQQGYGKLSAMAYANGYSEQYSYNDLGLLTALYKNGSNTPSYTYRYDALGNLTFDLEKCLHGGGEDHSEAIDADMQKKGD